MTDSGLSIGIGPPRERADAARNRVRLLEAAARVFARDGIDNVSLDCIAAEAGVGKGTLYRRFGSKAGLAAAVLDQCERDVQEAILFGPPPLGPGARPEQRLHAFIARYVEMLWRNLDLIHLAETAHPGARYEVGVYRFWHTHIRILLDDLTPTADTEFLAHALLAVLAADLVRALVRDGMSFDRIHAGAIDAVQRVLRTA